MTVITASYAQKALIEAGYPVKELHTIHISQAQVSRLEKSALKSIRHYLSL